MLCALESAQTNRVDAIQLLLNMLGHPLIGAVQGDPVSGYVLATDPKVVRLRRDPLGQRIAAVGGY